MESVPAGWLSPPKVFALSRSPRRERLLLYSWDSLALSLVISALLAGLLARVSPQPGRQRGRFFPDSSAFISPWRDAEVSSILHRYICAV